MQIEVENLGKRFNREWIFKSLSYTFEQGRTYALIGPNGSGKSTLLQTLWGQMLPSAGSMKMISDGQPLPSEDWFRHVSIATPYMELIEEFTLAEMVRFHFRFKRMRPGFSLDDLAARMELSHAKDKFVSQFSSGMRQRLKLALAFYSQADAVFLDEPCTNLDKKAMDWYKRTLAEVTGEVLVIIASNQEYEYPENAVKINILDYK